MKKTYIKKYKNTMNEIILSKRDINNEKLQKKLEYLFHVHGIPDVILKRKKIKESLNIVYSNNPIKKILLTNKGFNNNLIQRKIFNVINDYSTGYHQDPDIVKKSVQKIAVQPQRFYQKK